MPPCFTFGVDLEDLLPIAGDLEATCSQFGYQMVWGAWGPPRLILRRLAAPDSSIQACSIWSAQRAGV